MAETDTPDTDDTAPAAPAGESPRVRLVKRVVRAALFVLGVAAVVALVENAGVDAVLQTIVRAGPWLPVVIALEVGFMSMDVLALRSLAGDHGRDVPGGAWLRSAFVAYGIMILLPAGRAGGEIVRAATLGRHVGMARAAAMGTRLQAATMLANSVISVPCYVAVALASDAGQPLAWLVLGNGLITGVIGGAIVLASRRSNIGGWLGTKIRRLGAHGSTFDQALRAETPWLPAIAWCSLGRALQALQYGVILLAVGGTLTVTSALVSQGIHLVGAGLGDMVPNQVGITEGAYRLFADVLGLGSEPARAIGIALVARICQTSLAAVSLAAGAFLRSHPDPARA